MAIPLMCAYYLLFGSLSNVKSSVGLEFISRNHSTATSFYILCTNHFCREYICKKTVQVITETDQNGPKYARILLKPKVDDKSPFTRLFQSHSTMGKSVQQLYNSLCRAVETATMRKLWLKRAEPESRGPRGKFLPLYYSTKLEVIALH